MPIAFYYSGYQEHFNSIGEHLEKLPGSLQKLAHLFLEVAWQLFPSCIPGLYQKIIG